MEEAAEIVEDDGFEFCGGGRAQPIESWSGKGGGVEFAEEGRVGCVCGEESHEARRLP